jgi:eukaryotic-like serine/threonine-protein kinase
VGDFGIAGAVSAATSRLADDGIAAGSPAYMSPEQASADVVDGRSDVYSLGCVMYEMLAGTRPFTGMGSRSTLAQRFTNPPPTLRTVRDDIPPGVDDVVLKALARVPADRYQTAEELVAVIEAAIVSAPSREQSTSPRETHHSSSCSRFNRRTTDPHGS